MSTEVNRDEWLEERRRAVERVYDAEAPTYDQNEYPTAAQHEWVERLLAMLPTGSLVLDAPCGTGRYFAMATDAGMRVVGVDGSAGMLEQARGRGVAERLDHVRLQDLGFDREFDGSITVDAMENVPLEDWPVVLRNLRHAVRPGGLLYLTVEEIDGAEIDAAYRELTARGLPAVQGELMEGDVAGYHYYPPRAQVLDWFASAGFSVMDEGSSQEDQGWGYRHFLLRA